ncbi:MAG: bifunctional 3,4-dihydroxy-2-butanone 4-phosphate synthase/GTP cyclohydrolase II [Campylobacterales bacterium]|nr:bifunctional 3,4-dihydroxy-2-butanone 4-phosphate synthase/GTP cyclohydrolase II [Campylobacterales bacterium]
MSKSEQRVLEAIKAIRNGEMIIMIDDEDRENEGDLVYAATFSTPEKVNFLITEAKGLICVTLEKEIANKLDLNPMVQTNTDTHGTAFTVSVDAVQTTTGISAPERDMTIKLLADPLAKPADFQRPGHIFPLIAKDGGVLVRTGHTEGATDICKMAGLTGAGVICEIIKEDGTMARRDDLEIFGEKHGLKTVFIADMIEYRLKRESLVKVADPEECEFLGYKVNKQIATDHKNRQHTVYTFGEVKTSTPVKFHIVGDDLKFLQNKDKYNGMIGACKYLDVNGGVLIFMDVTNTEEEATKDFGIGAQILHELGVKEISLLTTKKQDFIAVSGFGLELKEEIVIQ